MDEGLYEDVVTGELAARLSRLLDLEVEHAGVDDADAAGVLARHLGAAVERRLSSEKDPERRLALANQVLAAVDPAVRPVGATSRAAAPC